MIKRLSFLIALKNDECALIKTLESLELLAFSRDSWEVLIINGGDLLTEGVLDRFQFQVRCITEPDQGIYDAWNKGLLIASGEFVSFLGAGDRVRSQYFDVFDNMIKVNQGDLFMCRQQQWQPNGRKLRVFGKTWEWREFQQSFSIAHIGCWHRRSLFDQFGLFDSTYKVAGDYEWLLRVGENLKVSFTPEVLLDVPVGGVSDKPGLVFRETRRARATHTNASKWNLFYTDYAYRMRKTVRKWFWG
jgi:glycosyltransferase involved in cell wall biosynthesis